VYEGSLEYVYVGYAWQERSSIVDSGYVSQDNQWDITVRGALTDLALLSSVAAGRFIRSAITVQANSWVNNQPANNDTVNWSDVWLKANNLDEQVEYQGWASDLQNQSFTYPDAGSRLKTESQLLDANGDVYTLTVDTSGRLLINGTVVGTQA
jgi:hypothetical protein